MVVIGHLRMNQADPAILNNYLEQLAKANKAIQISNVHFPFPVEISVNAPDCIIEFSNISNLHNITIQDITLDTLRFASDFKDEKVNFKGKLNLRTLEINSASRNISQIELDGSKSSIGSISINSSSPIDTIKLIKTSADIYISSTVKNIVAESCFFGSSPTIFYATDSINITSTTFNKDFRTDKISPKTINIENCVIESDFTLRHGSINNLHIANCKFATNAPSNKVTLSRLTISNKLHISKVVNGEVNIGTSNINEVLVDRCINMDLRLLENEAIFQMNLRSSELPIFELRSNSSVKFPIQNLSISSSKIEYFSALDFGFKQTKATDTVFEVLTAKGSEFISSTHFQSCTFNRAPIFYNANIFPDLDFSGCIFANVVAESEAPFRRLKHLMKDIQNDRDEALFSGLELESHTEKLQWSRHFFRKSLGLVYKVTNNYGRSLLRPFWALIVSFLLGIALFQIQGVSYTPPLLKHPYFDTWYSEVGSFHNLWHSVLFSIFNCLGPLRLITSLNIFTPVTFGGVLFSWFQILFSSFLWYLIIAGIRRYFRSN